MVGVVKGNMSNKTKAISVAVVLALLVIGHLMGQQQISGTGAAVTQSGVWTVGLNTPIPAGANAIGTVAVNAALPAGANAIGTVSLNSALPAGANAIGTVAVNAALPAGANAIGTVAVNAPLPAGANSIGTVVNGPGNNVIGFVRVIPSGCSGQSTPAQLSLGQVAAGAGSTLSVITSCAVSCYANNITNSPVTLRLADKQATPMIWFGGASDYTIAANSNVRVPFSEGIVFTSGITAIAGTANAVNLQCGVYQ